VRAAVSIGLGLILVGLALVRLRRPADAPLQIGLGPRRAVSIGGLGLGVATGFLPCGALVPAWLLAAASGRALDGAAAMAAFALASLPGAPLGAWLLRRAGRLASPSLAALGGALAGLWLLLRPLWDARCH
jgi:sulfite exporter TauE/SafE